ncbi:hypothetical protein VKI21_11700 [Cyanobacterium aponinum UTEX 3222]|uniref:hypothetical protein n=1 Tax=Cyanobacterium aponinum TaxID=379064 RepID=UPI0030921ACC|nr:hypothetical protein VKI21_11700 [Cyanobacterium aponinum UTEX 3222]
MFNNIFAIGKKKKNDSQVSQNTDDSIQENEELKPVKSKGLSTQKQREEQIKRKKIIIKYFGKSLLNLQLETGIWTPVYIVDLYEVDFSQNQEDYAPLIDNALNECFEIHKQKLRQKIYRESFNLQPGELLIVAKEIEGEIFLSCKKFPYNIEKLIELLNCGFFTSHTHQLFFLRYFVPPIPDDLYKLDRISVPSKFELVIRKIIHYCDRTFTTDNLPYKKWENLINNLHVLGMIIKFPDREETVTIDALFTEDYSNIGYHRLKVEEIVKDTIDKNPIVIPLFILLLAFFCSDKHDSKIFSYHYLFSPTGITKKKSMERGQLSFFKLFNELLDESLLPNQFRKCMSTIYYEAFILHQYEIEDLLFKYREKYKQKAK